MTDKESFEDKLNRWTLNELKIERTKVRVYSQSKIDRINTRIAELEYGGGAEPTQETRDEMYIAEARLNSLRNLISSDFDLQRLIRLCEEINSSWQHNNLIAVGALTRILLDHVPPIFGHSSFAQVAANMPRSTKSVFDVLEQNSRNIFDRLIHQMIRKKETLPTDQMVNFSQNIDVLLSEVIRVTEENNA